MTAKDRLVQSAQALLWERGYVAMSPKAIQDRADVGQGSMYHHFGGKSDLAAAAIERSAAEFREGAEVWFSKPGTPLERIRGYMLRSRAALKGCQIGKLTQDPEIANDVRLRKPLESTFTWLHHRLEGLIRESQASSEISGEFDAADLAAMLVAAIQGGYVLAAAQNSPLLFHSSIRGALSLLEASAA